MDHSLDPYTILLAYEKRFGAAGEFDQYLLPGDVNVRLMQNALQCDQPVTAALLATVYKTIEGEPPTDPPPGALT
jgi:hypothetical protein